MGAATWQPWGLLLRFSGAISFGAVLPRHVCVCVCTHVRHHPEAQGSTLQSARWILMCVRVEGLRSRGCGRFRLFCFQTLLPDL